MNTGGGIDLLDFSGEDMYFDRPLPPRVEALLATAAAGYGREDSLAGDELTAGAADFDPAELALLRAYLLAPEHLSVLVALYRFFYYRQRLPEALLIADRAVAAASHELGLPPDWRTLTGPQIAAASAQSMALTRFLLLALKGAGYLLMRLDDAPGALARLEKVAEFDGSDRLGLTELLSWARKAVARAEVAAAGGNVAFIG